MALRVAATPLSFDSFVVGLLPNLQNPGKTGSGGNDACEITQHALQREMINIGVLCLNRCSARFSVGMPWEIPRPAQIGSRIEQHHTSSNVNAGVIP